MDGRKIMGFIIVITGILLMLNSADVIDFSLGWLLSNYWPMILVFIGLFNIINNPDSKVGGIIVLTIGLLFQVRTLGYFDIFEYLEFWPVVLIVIGLWIIFSRGGREKVRSDSKDTFSVLGLFSGPEVRNSSQDFKGGSATAIFGGADIDLRQAKIPEGREANIDLFVAFGGLDIFVPQDWNIVIKGVPLFGGWSNKTINKSDESDRPVLKINAFILFGGFDLNN